MAEKPLIPVGQKPLGPRLGLSREPSPNAKYLRALLTFLREAGSEQIRQIPGVGPILAGASAAIAELSEEEDDQKLEQSIEKILTVGEQTQDQINLLAAVSLAVFARIEPLIQSLSDAGISTEPKQLSAFAASTALIAYRSRIVEEFKWVDYRGISGSVSAEHATSLALDDVYIQPFLLPEHARADINEREISLLKQLEDPDLSPDQKTLCHEEYLRLTGGRWRTGSEGIVIGDILQKTRHVVVKGNPGVGKSMLIRSLARACALGDAEMQKRLNWEEDLIPIVLPLAAFADARRKSPQLTLREFLDQVMTARGGEALRDAIALEMDSGRVFVMLDGVDEVPEDTARAALVQAVDTFIIDHRHNYCLVTSRPYGYVRLAGDLAHYQLLNFTQDQVATFVHQWQRTFERWLHPQAPNLESADREAEAMLGEIRGNSKVAELATNPLILVIISLIRYAKIRLPDKRVELYAHAVDTLMETWNQWRSLLGKDMGGIQLPRERLITVWSSAAEWMRRTRPTGVVRQEDLKRELVRILRAEEYDEQNPEATAISYLKAAANQAGLLEERGPGIFAFWHPTFEEYLAAVKLSTPTGTAQESLLRLRDDPRWREVILLAVGHIGVIGHDERTATDIVKAIADAGPASPLEPLLHSRLLLAAACVADDVGIKRSLGREIVVRLGKIVQSFPYDPFEQTFANTVRALPRLRLKPEEIVSLSSLASHEEWQIRMAYARLCSNVAESDPHARQACRSLLDDDDPDVRCHAALGLARAGEYSPQVLGDLGGFLSQHADIEQTVREFFSNPNPKLEAALPELYSSTDASRKLSIFVFLAQLGREDEAVDVLVGLLNEPDANIRYQAASLLVQLGRVDEPAVDVLVGLLNEPDANIRYQAASLLVQLGRVDEPVDVLVDLLNEPDANIRYQAASRLAQLGRVDEPVDALVGLLNEPDANIRYQAASRLAQLGRVDEPVDVLVGLLNEPDANIRYQAASTLAQLGRVDESAVDVLVGLLNEPDANIRYQAASLLVQLGREDEAVDVLVGLLNEPDANIRYQAASTLVRLDRADEPAVDALISLLKDTNANIRYQAASTLVRLDRADEKVVKTVIDLVLDTNANIRYQAAFTLAQLDRADEKVVKIILELAHPGQEPPQSFLQSVLSGQVLATYEGQRLADIVCVQENDTRKQRVAKSWLFDCLWENLMPKQKTA